MIALVAAALCPAVGLASAAGAAETCHEQPHQFGKSRICVSSVLPSQGSNKYGPDNLVGMTDDGAWCEGASGPGIGERITYTIAPRQLFRTVLITNGYAKSDEAFRRNGRVKRMLVEADGSFKKSVTLKDTREPQKIVLPKAKMAQVRFTIEEIYPGLSGSDTCISLISPNLEEFNN